MFSASFSNELDVFSSTQVSGVDPVVKKIYTRTASTFTEHTSFNWVVPKDEIDMEIELGGLASPSNIKSLYIESSENVIIKLNDSAVGIRTKFLSFDQCNIYSIKVTNSTGHYTSATASIFGGGVTGVVVVGGADFMDGATIAFSGGTPTTPATGVVNVASNGTISVSITSPGTGYVTAPTATITPITFNDASLQIVMAG